MHEDHGLYKRDPAVQAQRDEMAKVLSSQPKGASLIVKRMWMKMKANRVELFEKYWRMVLPQSPMFHTNGTYEYKELNNGDN